LRINNRYIIDFYHFVHVGHTFAEAELVETVLE